MSDGAVAGQAARHAHEEREGWFRISSRVKWHYIKHDPAINKAVTVCFRYRFIRLPNRLCVTAMLPVFAMLCAMCASQRGVYLNNDGTVRLDQA